MSIWDILSIEETNDVSAIKSAYAKKSKEIHPEEHPEEFKDLHDAYRIALRYAKNSNRREYKNDSPFVDSNAFFTENEEVPKVVIEEKALENDENENIPKDNADELDFEVLKSAKFIEHSAKKEEEEKNINLIISMLYNCNNDENARKDLTAWKSIIAKNSFQRSKTNPDFMNALKDFFLNNKGINKQVINCFIDEFNRNHAIYNENYETYIKLKSTLINYNRKRPFYEKVSLNTANIKDKIELQKSSKWQKFWAFIRIIIYIMFFGLLSLFDILSYGSQENSLSIGTAFVSLILLLVLTSLNFRAKYKEIILAVFDVAFIIGTVIFVNSNDVMFAALFYCSTFYFIELIRIAICCAFKAIFRRLKKLKMK